MAEPVAGQDNDAGTPSMVVTVRATVLVVAILSLLVCSTRVRFDASSVPEYDMRNSSVNEFLEFIALHAKVRAEELRA